jgi:hypothetical protein
MTHTWRSYPQARVEYRVVCGNVVHLNHCFEFRTMEKAESGAAYLNDTNGTHPECEPWVVETRTISEWRQQP